MFTHYPYPVVLDDRVIYILWATDEAPHDYEPDEVVLNESGDMPVFADIYALRSFAERHGLAMADDWESHPLRLDVVDDWLRNPSDDIDCPTFLNTWNLFSDLATSLNGRRSHIDDRQYMDIYDKVFFGNNLPPVTPPGEYYVPAWSDDEIAVFVELFSEWLAKFRSLMVEEADAQCP